MRNIFLYDIPYNFQAYLETTMCKTISSAYNILPWNLGIFLLSFLANMSGGSSDDFNRLENSLLMQEVSGELLKCQTR